MVLLLIKTDLGLSDVQSGLVASLFIAAFGLVVPVAIYTGDVLSRKRVVIFSLVTWSIATVLTGFGTGLAFLNFVRSLATGVGEVFYAPRRTLSSERTTPRRVPKHCRCTSQRCISG